jgi:hypothetical protein
MLVYPFTFYAVNGFSRMFSTLQGRATSFSTWFSNKKLVAVLVLTFGLGIAYLATPVTMVYANASVPAVTNTYLYFSTSPTVPYEDVNDVVQAMSWLNGAMDSASCVILQHAYQFWGQLYLNSSHSVVTFEKNPALAAATAFEHGFSKVYFVWWNEPNGWYGVSVPQSFVSVQGFGHVSVYVYGGTSVGGS